MATRDRLGQVGQGNLATRQLVTGAPRAAEAKQRRTITLCREIETEFWEACGHQELGRLLAYRGAYAEAQAELATALAMFEKPEQAARAARAGGLGSGEPGLRPS